MKTIATYQQVSILIEGILDKYLSDKEQQEFTGNHEKIHRCFYELKNKHPEYFQRLSFDVNSNYPYSKDLDAILQDFQICGIINKLNPTFKTIKFNGDKNYKTRKVNKIPFVKDEEFIDFAAELSL